MKNITITTIILIWLDMIFTAIFIKKFGIEIEANIIGRFLFQRPILLIFTKLLSSIFIWYMYKTNIQLSRICLIIVFIIFSLINFYHIFLTIKVLTIFK